MSSTVRKDETGNNHESPKRTSITVLVLGDEGVGKSSLISTFVSRHFSEVVPGIMTRVRLPPDPENSCITTIVDSQGGDAALMSAVANRSIPGSSHPISGGGGIGAVHVGGGNPKQPPQPQGGADSSSTTTGGATTNPGAALLNLQKSLSASATSGTHHVGGIENVDSIILVYDLDRDETFFRLENHWLPLIERCFNGDLPVIVAGNKMDLFLPSSTAGVSDEQVLARSRQQIVSLMQRFRFIRQCIKCSAKNLLRVDEVFLKAQQAVLYPFTPLYDLDIGRLSEDCKRAFTRIFRMYDRDHDGLLSHAELDRFQHETFHVPVYERDLTGWKKVVTRNNPNEEVVRDGKFTVAGFLAIFDVFISQNRLDVPWQALRKFGYDDNLVLHVPESIKQGTETTGTPGQPSPQYKEHYWSLTPSARRFLTDIFHQFDSDSDGVLSLEDIQSIFSIVASPALPPWHPLRAQEEFEGCFSLPIMPSSSESRPDSSSSSPDGASSPLNMSQSLSASGITIVSGESFPSVDISAVSGSFTNVISKPLSFLEWMGLWHAISAISPPQTRAELFRLGHVEDPKRYKKSRRGKKKSAVAPNVSSDSLLPSREVRALLLGSPGSGKTAFLNALGCTSRDPLATSKTRSPRTSSTFVKLKRKTSKSTSDSQSEAYVVHLIITEVPEAAAENQAQRRKELSEILQGGGCDLAILVFDSTNSASLAYAKHLESSLLTDDMSRVYVGTKSDQCATTEDRDVEEDDEWQPTTVIDEAGIHCRELDLEPPLVTSANDTMLSADGELGELQRQKALEHLARCVLSDESSGSKRLRAKPHEERKRQEAAKRRNRKMIWFGVGVGVAVAVVGYLITGTTGGSSSPKQDGKGRARLSWFRSLFSLGSSGTTAAADSPLD